MHSSTNAVNRVLIMDDDPILCAIAESFFKRRGATDIWMASDGKEALDLLHDRSSEIDFILTDLNMPKLDGVQFLRYMKKCAYDGPFAIISSEHDAVVRTVVKLARSHDLNLIGALKKPFNPNAVEELLGALKPKSLNGAEVAAQIRVTANDLEAALAAGQIVPYYQPKVDVATGKVKSAECLARWMHPELGVLPPGLFVPIAEDNGLVLALTEAILGLALDDAALWRRYGVNIGFAVNLSAESLERLDFPDHVAACVDIAGVDRSRFIFEITESQILNNHTAALEVLTRLRLLGFEVSIDDFGTGYSNIENLCDFPFTELKIDRSFIQNAASDPFSRTCVEASVNLGKKLNLRVVAEGVETEQDRDFVTNVGVDEIQGYYFSEPLPSDQFLRWYLDQ